MPQGQEKAELSELKAIYEEKIELLCTKLELNNVRRQLAAHKNVNDFTSRLILDCYTDSKFTHWLEECALNKSKLAVLKSQDIAGKILLSLIEKYGIETVLVSTHGNFNGMSEDELEKCRQADIIICADVHNNTTIERDGLTAIRIADLIK